MVKKESRLCNSLDFAAVLETEQNYLTELDSAIDADHGINMDRGFKR